MSVVADVIAKLKALPATPFKAVEGLAELALLTKDAGKPNAQISLKVSPSVFVVPLGDGSQRADRASTAFHQETSIRFGCLIALREVSDPKGGAAVVSIDGLKSTLRDYLVSWTPPSALYPVEHARGALVGIINGLTFWQEEFLCGAQIRKGAA